MRKYRGARVSTAKMNDRKVAEARDRYGAGWSISALAREYEVTWLSMSRVVKRQSWKHVD